MDERNTLERLWRQGPMWAMVTINVMGFRCGYVLLPDGHPWIGRRHDDIEVDVHGGLTFSGEYSAEFLRNGDGVPGGWWIGFDCGHAWDNPEPDYYRLISGGRDWPGTDSGHVWATDEVAAEVARLAVQVEVAQVAASVGGPG